MHAQEISYTLPDLNTLMAPYGMPEDWFDSFGYLNFYAEIAADGNKLSCANTNSCRIIPHWSYTPIWYGLSPPVVYPG